MMGKEKGAGARENGGWKAGEDKVGSGTEKGGKRSFKKARIIC